MRISLHAVGQIKSGPEAELCALFQKRTRTQGRNIGITSVDVREVSESRHRSADGRKAEEAERLVAALAADARAVALTETGKTFTSAQFAGYLGDALDTGETEIAFLIGGPDGHHRTVLERTALHLSLGVMTWPHRLARAMLLEQVYRAVTILSNHPYHRA